MADNTVLNAGSGGDTIRDLARSSGTVKTPVVQLDIGGATANAEVLVTAGQQTMAASLPVVMANNQTPIATVATSNGLISANNSSTAMLAASSSFIGAAEDVTEYADLRVSVFSDQVSATDGLQIQQSSNGTNWDVVDVYTITSGSGKTFSAGISGRYVRIVYNNGPTAQGVFRLQTKYHKAYSKGSSVRPQDGRANDLDAEETLAYAMGFDGTSWNRLRATVANGLLADVSRIVGALPAGSNLIGNVATKGLSITPTSASIAAAGTGKIGPVDTSAAGNVTIIVKSTTPATPYVGAPVIVFEQSDDGVSWASLQAVRTDTGVSNSSFTLASGVANASIMFEASVVAIAWVRVRVTTGPTTNAMTVSVNPGSLPFAPSVSVFQQPLTKAIQGTQGVTTQDLKDSGRVARNITVDSYAVAATSETMMSLSVSADGATLTTAASFAVTAGKRFRVQSISLALHTIAGNTTSVSVIVRVRVASTTININSPLQFIGVLSGTALAFGGSGPVSIAIPDGWEILGGLNLGVSATCAGFVATTAAPKINIAINGYEY